MTVSGGSRNQETLMAPNSRSAATTCRPESNGSRRPEFEGRWRAYFAGRYVFATVAAFFMLSTPVPQSSERSFC